MNATNIEQAIVDGDAKGLVECLRQLPLDERMKEAQKLREAVCVLETVTCHTAGEDKETRRRMAGVIREARARSAGLVGIAQAEDFKVGDLVLGSQRIRPGTVRHIEEASGDYVVVDWPGEITGAVENPSSLQLFERKAFEDDMAMPNMSYEEWVDKYIPIRNTIKKNAPYDGTMFETFGLELDFVKKADEKKVWTLVDGDNGSVVIVAGYHHVNRIGYFITEKTWHDDSLTVIVFDEDDEEEEEEEGMDEALVTDEQKQILKSIMSNGVAPIKGRQDNTRDMMTESAAVETSITDIVNLASNMFSETVFGAVTSVLGEDQAKVFTECLLENGMGTNLVEAACMTDERQQAAVVSEAVESAISKYERLAGAPMEAYRKRDMLGGIHQAVTRSSGVVTQAAKRIKGQNAIKKIVFNKPVRINLKRKSEMAHVARGNEPINRNTLQRLDIVLKKMFATGNSLVGDSSSRHFTRALANSVLDFYEVLSDNQGEAWNPVVVTKPKNNAEQPVVEAADPAQSAKPGDSNLPTAPATGPVGPPKTTDEELKAEEEGKHRFVVSFMRPAKAMEKVDDGGKVDPGRVEALVRHVRKCSMRLDTLMSNPEENQAGPVALFGKAIHALFRFLVEHPSEPWNVIFRRD